MEHRIKIFYQSVRTFGECFKNLSLLRIEVARGGMKNLGLALSYCNWKRQQVRTKRTSVEWWYNCIDLAKKDVSWLNKIWENQYIKRNFSIKGSCAINYVWKIGIENTASLPRRNPRFRIWKPGLTRPRKPTKGSYPTEKPTMKLPTT